MAINPRLAAIGPSLIRAVAAKRRPGSIDLGIGEPALRPSLAPFDEALRWVAENGCPYSPNAGLPELRERIAAHYGYPGCTDGQSVCITNGSQEALHAVFSALLDPACDEVLIVEPAFGSYVKLAELAGITVRTAALDATDGFAFDAARICAALTPRTRLLVICSPCNPTGRTLDAVQAQKLADHLRDRAGEPVIVLFDEVYRELRYAAAAVDFARLYAPVIAVNSLSKSNALTGLRLGWALGPRELIEPVIRAHTWATSAASTYAQRVALAIFADPKHLAEHSAWYRERAAEITALLERRKIAFAPIEGGFYAFMRFPGVADSVATAMTLAEEDDVLVIPGRAFGASGEGWLRMSWVAPLERIEEGLNRIVRRFG